MSAQYLKVLLQQQNGLGSVMVDRSQTCYGYSWDIKWASGGYKAPLIVRILSSFRKNIFF